VAYSLGGILSSLVISPFSLAWFPAMFSIAKKDDAPRIFQLIFRWYALSLLFATLSLSFFGVSVLDLFFPPVYHAAAPVIPIIALSTACSGFSVMLSIGVSIQRKSWLATLFTTISALLNIGLNIVLIPFKRWSLFRAISLLIRGTLSLVTTSADIYHVLDLPALPACYIAGQYVKGCVKSRRLVA
jgi:O-antigen/teichoic acid export membrane protein